MQEKRQHEVQGKMQMRARLAGRSPAPQMGTQTLAPSMSAGALPPLNVGRNPDMGSYAQTLTPHRSNQGYMPLSQ